MYLAAQQFQLQQMWVCTSLFATNQVSKPLTAEKKKYFQIALKMFEFVSRINCFNGKVKQQLSIGCG